MNLTFATVQTGNYCDRGAEYLAKLVAGVRTNMPGWVDLNCVCFTDDPAALPSGVEARPVPFGPPSWWQKLWLFAPGVFRPGERIFYSDLDAIMRGDLGDFAEYDGDFAIMRDPYNYDRVGSAVMGWEAGKADHIWTRWEEAGRPSFDPRGDQNWIEAMQPKRDYWQDILPEQIVSFKADCMMKGTIPDNARILMFHGRPRPHECQAPFVKELWNRPLIAEAA